MPGRGRRGGWVALLLLGPVLPSVVSCTADGQEEGDGVAVDAEIEVVVLVEVFSGRENPTLVLSGEEADRMADLLDGLPVGSTPVVASGEGRLGFDRFVVEVESAGTRRLHLVDPVSVHQVLEATSIEELLGAGSDADLLLLPVADEDGRAYAALHDLASRRLDPATVEAIPAPR